MRLLYLSGSYVPSRRASSVHVMRMCAALARRGHRVSLATKLCAARQEPAVGDDFAFYGVEPAFELVKLPRPAARLGGVRFAWEVDRLLGRRRGDVDLVYARDITAAALAARHGLPLVLELHLVPDGWWAARLLRRVTAYRALRRLVAVSSALARDLRASGLVPQELELVVAPDGADPLPAPPADRPPPAGVTGGGPSVGYVGHLYTGRGIETIVELARQRPTVGFHLVGGSDEHLAAWRARRLPANLTLHGFVPPAELPAYYRAFDVLLMPYQTRVMAAGNRADIGAWLSPMKLFEYMAAGKPIVSSDLPVLREVLEDGRNALLVAPDEPAAWLAAVDRLLAEPELAERLAAAAAGDLLDRYSWEARARRVMAGL